MTNKARLLSRFRLTTKHTPNFNSRETENSLLGCRAVAKSISRLFRLASTGRLSSYSNCHFAVVIMANSCMRNRLPSRSVTVVNTHKDFVHALWSLGIRSSCLTGESGEKHDPVFEYGMSYFVWWNREIVERILLKLGRKKWVRRKEIDQSVAASLNSRI